MSIQRRERQKGVVFVVHYYDTDQRKYVNRTFFDPTKTEKQNLKDAQAFEAMVMLAKRRGDLDELDAGRETLAEFEKEWWKNYVEPHLAEHTKRSYRFALDKFILPDLGRHQLRRINPRLLNTWINELKTSPSMKRKSFLILQGMLERAVEWDHLNANPAKIVKNPKAPRKNAPRAIHPDEIERLRESYDKPLDKALISVLAYGGLRPGEALALQWEDISDRTILVNKALSHGEEKGTKNGRVRVVEMLSVLKQDLLEWQVASGRREGLVFPRPDGQPWTARDYDSWRERFRRRVPKGTRPYDLRHSYASLRFAERKSPSWVADQMGHTLDMLLHTYVHLLEGTTDYIESADDLIRAARQNPDRTQTGEALADSL